MFIHKCKLLKIYFVMSEIIRIFVKYLQVFLMLNMYGYKCKY